jgi:hypothetical protein
MLRPTHRVFLNASHASPATARSHLSWQYAAADDSLYRARDIVLYIPIQRYRHRSELHNTRRARMTTTVKMRGLALVGRSLPSYAVRRNAYLAA